MKWLLILTFLLAILGCNEGMATEKATTKVAECCADGLAPIFIIGDNKSIIRIKCRLPSTWEEIKFAREMCRPFKSNWSPKGPQASGACLDQPDTAGFPPEDAFASGPTGCNSTGPLP